MSEQDKLATNLKFKFQNQMLMIGAEGYGEYAVPDGKGYPVVVEHYGGDFRVLVWADINNPEPTHVISLECAKESAREPEMSDEEAIRRDAEHRARKHVIDAPSPGSTSYEF